jgi:predicted dehydrogenase
VLICADTRANDPVELAGVLARDRGTVVAIGAFGMDIPRKVYYEKELVFKISRSYGPGRYDPSYEEAGRDYPYGYVRWTEGRNIAAFIDLLAKNLVDVKPLISHRFPIQQAEEAYELITGKSKEAFLGVLLTYPEHEKIATPRKVFVQQKQPSSSTPLHVGVLGAGNYAQAVFLPAIKKAGGASLTAIASASGLSAAHAAQKFGFFIAASDENEILANPDINTVVILTRHQQHARQVITALQNGKAVYCEKPLAVTLEELGKVEKTLSNQPGAFLTVGFNRRYAPFAIKVKEFIQAASAPMVIHYRVNAGFLPSNHWLHDPAQGGGRIIGEGCHFIDLCTFLTGEAPITVTTQALPDGGQFQQDNCSITLQYNNGSIAVVQYLANGNKNFPKERLEVFAGGRIGVLDDFRVLELVTETKRSLHRSRFSQDKGHLASWQNFLQSIKTSIPPIPYEELVSVTRASFAAVESMNTGKTVSLNG